MEIGLRRTDFKRYLGDKIDWTRLYCLDEWQIVVSTSKLENIGRQADLKREGGGDNRPSFKNFEFEKNPNGFFQMEHGFYHVHSL